MQWFKCAGCGKDFQAKPRNDRNSQRRYCSVSCHSKHRPIGSLYLRFWKYVEITDSCWLWTGYTQDFGYGCLMVREPGQRPRLIRAHRIAWELHVGPIPEGLCVLHHCDVPRCVNFMDHLFLGTKQDNSTDAVSKGRVARGDRSGNATLSDKDIAEVWRLHGEGMRQKDIGKLLGVSHYVIYSIIHKRTWKHLAPSL